MTQSDYDKVLGHLESAAGVLVAHQGELSEGDIRIRHLVSISISEVKRRLGELRRANQPQVVTPEGGGMGGERP